MHRILIAALLVATAFLSGCASKFQAYEGPEVTRILVFKEKRLLALMHERETLKVYRFKLGFEPTGHKVQSGDGKTPEGHYYIDRRNPDSDFHLSIGISYPNARDVQVARRLGVSPGGDIFIHGTPRKFRRVEEDWTWGCIAVSNKEMEEIYAMVRTGTPISIYP